VWRTLCARNLQAVVNFAEPQKAEGRNRREWAADLRERIVAMRAEQQG
jgi:1-acyl-sn-glycerol-3-phosphate acyltransferase